MLDSSAQITVDPETAFAELGLEAPTSAEAIRRAYLRGVRQHSPERDPEGFQRVRAAYEVLRSAPWLWQAKPEGVRRPSPPVDVGGDATSAVVVRDDEPATGPVAATAEQEVEEDPLLEELYGLDGPALRTSIPVWEPLEEALRLIRDGEVARARAVVGALDERTQALGVRATEMGPLVIARWTLVTELLALEGVATDELLRALAEGVSSGDLDEAEILFKTWREESAWRSGRDFKARAPNLYKTLAGGAARPRLRNGFTKWSWIWMGWVVIQVVRGCVLPAFDHEHRSSAPELLAGGPKQRARPEAPPARPLAATARRIDEAVRFSDCNTVREQWPFYAAEARKIPNSAPALEDYAARRRQVMARCPELERELTESP